MCAEGLLTCRWSSKNRLEPPGNLLERRWRRSGLNGAFGDGVSRTCVVWPAYRGWIINVIRIDNASAPVGWANECRTWLSCFLDQTSVRCCLSDVRA